MFLSVIVPTCHRNDLLALCLDCLAPGIQTLDSSQYEVIVSDDGSKSTSEELIRANYPWVKWVQGPRRGPAANRNYGSRQAKGEWLVFIDDDCLPNLDLLDSYQRVIEDNSMVKVFEGRIYVDRPKQRHDEESPINETGGYLWSCNFCIKKSVFNELRGFDETFPFAAMEDVDLHCRLKEMGLEILFLRDAAVLHPWRKFGGLAGEIKKIKSTAHYLAKHPKEKSRLNSMFYLRSIYHTLRNSVLDFSKFGFKGINFVPIRIGVLLYAIFLFKKVSQ